MSGPFLPLELEHTTALSDGEEVWLIGGKTSAGKNQDLIFRLKSGKWQVQKTKLEVARSSHVALLVPNSFFRCWTIMSRVGERHSHMGWRLTSAQRKAVVFMKLQNFRDSSQRAITKFDWQLGRYELIGTALKTKSHYLWRVLMLWCFRKASST